MNGHLQVRSLKTILQDGIAHQIVLEAFFTPSMRDAITCAMRYMDDGQGDEVRLENWQALTVCSRWLFQATVDGCPKSWVRVK